VFQFNVEDQKLKYQVIFNHMFINRRGVKFSNSPTYFVGKN
jgi:hypothetical protein